MPAASDALRAFANCKSIPNLLDLLTAHLHRLVNMDWCGLRLSFADDDATDAKFYILFNHGLVTPPQTTPFAVNSNIPSFASFLQHANDTIFDAQGAICAAQSYPCEQTLCYKLNANKNVSALLMLGNDTRSFKKQDILVAYNIALAFAAQLSNIASTNPSSCCNSATNSTHNTPQATLATDLLKSIVAGTGAHIGEHFFKSVVKNLAQALTVSYAFVGKLAADRTKIETIAVWHRDNLMGNFTYKVEGDRGCADKLCYCGESVVKLMPNQALQHKMRVKSCWALPLNDSGDTTIGVLVVMHDVPLSRDEEIIPIMKIFASRTAAELERLYIEERVFKQNERAQVTLGSIGDGVITTDGEGKVEYLNPAAEQITGWNSGDAKGKSLQDIAPIKLASADAATHAYVNDCLFRKKKIAFREDHMLINKYGREVPISAILSPMLDKGEKVSGLVMAIQDVSEVRSAINVLTYQARHDMLTGLLNRAAFELVLDNAIANSQHNKIKHALLYIDLDHFKLVNDSAGHLAGDELLRRVAMELKKHTRTTDTLSRLGGDEFAILLSNCPVPVAGNIANEIRERIRGLRFRWQGVSYDISASIGVTRFAPDIGDLSMLLSIADSACYIAKSKGKNYVHIDNPADKDSDNFSNGQQIMWPKRIKDALTNNKFVLYNQEIRSIDKNDNEPKKYELLVRMIDDNGALIPPMSFIPAAERYDLMYDIDKWVISNAFGMIAKNCREKNAHRHAIYSINLSGATLCKGDFYDFVADQFKTNDIPPQYICFEITETAAVTNLTVAQQLIKKLKALGCLFSLDDFGSGMSSFSYLKHLDVDYIKIDGQFVKDMINDPISCKMVDVIAQMGRTMGLKTVAEFVENDEIFVKLKELGVDFAQGYGVSMPTKCCF
ncbi:MAG: EAL domain-containing protein [Pseudomonadota bacterium]